MVVVSHVERISMYEIIYHGEIFSRCEVLS